jgi:hypothetical protein
MLTSCSAVRVDDAVQALDARGKEVKINVAGSMLVVTLADDDAFLGEIQCRALLPFFNGLYPVQHRAFLLGELEPGVLAMCWSSRTLMPAPAIAARSHNVAFDLSALTKLTETYRRKIKNVVFNDGGNVTFLSRKGAGKDAADYGAEMRAVVAAEPRETLKGVGKEERARIAQARLEEAIAERRKRRADAQAAAAAQAQPVAGPSGVKHEGDVKPEVPAVVAAAEQGERGQDPRAWWNNAIDPVWAALHQGVALVGAALGRESSACRLCCEQTLMLLV